MRILFDLGRFSNILVRALEAICGSFLEVEVVRTTEMALDLLEKHKRSNGSRGIRSESPCFQFWETGFGHWIEFFFRRKTILLINFRIMFLYHQITCRWIPNFPGYSRDCTYCITCRTNHSDLQVGSFVKMTRQLRKSWNKRNARLWQDKVVFIYRVRWEEGFNSRPDDFRDCIRDFN